MSKKIFVLVVLIMLATATVLPARSGGGGGMLIGYQMTSYPFLESYPLASDLPLLVYYGGYGYGVGYDGAIVGGFGYAIMDVAGESKIAGGFGGFVSGFRIIERPINLSIVSWTGFGGISTGTYQAGGYRGYFAFVQELTLEVGFPIIRWFMPTIYAGYQVAGNLIPGLPFQSFLSYTPVMGLRIQWGSFR